MRSLENLTSFAAWCKLVTMKREKQKPPAPDEWTAEQLLAAATSVSLRQLERWRKQDLVPRPRTIHLGQGPGTCSVYPPGTDEQLLAVYRLYAKKRNAHYVRWYLWMEGYPIPLPAIRKTLDALVLAPIRELQTASGQADGFDATEVVVQQALPSLERSRRGRALRKRLNYNEADVQSAMTLFFGLLFGAEDLSFHSDLLDEEVGELSPAQILIRTLGVERAQTDRIGDGEPWLQSDVAENFQDASEMGLFSLENLSLALERVGREELDQAREMSDLFLWGLQMVVPYLEAQFGPGAFGLAMVHEISFDDPAWRAFLLLGFLCWRNKGLSSGIDQVLAAFRTLRDASADNTQAGVVNSGVTLA